MLNPVLRTGAPVQEELGAGALRLAVPAPMRETGALGEGGNVPSAVTASFKCAQAVARREGTCVMFVSGPPADARRPTAASRRPASAVGRRPSVVSRRDTPARLSPQEGVPPVPVVAPRPPHPPQGRTRDGLTVRI